MATLVLADDDLRCKFNEEMSIAQTRLDNIFGMAALIAAYNDGEEWLDQPSPTSPTTRRIWISSCGSAFLRSV